MRTTNINRYIRRKIIGITCSAFTHRKPITNTTNSGCVESTINILRAAELTERAVPLKPVYPKMERGDKTVKYPFKFSWSVLSAVVQDEGSLSHHPNMTIKDEMTSNDSSIGVPFPTRFTFTICCGVAFEEAPRSGRELIHVISIDGNRFSNKDDKPKVSRISSRHTIA